MKKEDIQYEVNELARLRSKLHEANEAEEITTYLMNIYYNMCDLMSEADYADAAEEVIQCMEKYGENHVLAARKETLGKLNELIEKMHEDMQKPEEPSQMQTICKEAAVELKKVSKRFERNLKKVIKSCLKEYK